MAANAGGPPMSLYFTASGLPVLRFLGTQAWFFFLINVVKLPFSISLGLLNSEVMKLSAILLPIVLIAAFVGRWTAHRFNQELFNRLVIGLTVVSSLYLIIQ